jgi:ABC-type nitrate/sulfonate/bicarbonate transport system substrate-binding protein
MTTQQQARITEQTNPDEIWFTRCPVPTATGLSYKLGWLEEEFSKDGISIKTLQDSQHNQDNQYGKHHYDHQLPTLIREGGNILALGARAQGAKTRLIVILVRKDSDIKSPKDLKGKRLALPDWSKTKIESHARGSSIARGMSLQGYRGALRYAGLGFEDVTLVQVDSESTWGNQGQGQRLGNGLWKGLEYLQNNQVDAVYVKGASAVDAAARFGAVVGIDLDALPDRKFRVNNGTPRPITVHEDFLENHFDLLVRFLAQTLRAADWAKDNLDAVQSILSQETRGSIEGVSQAYKNDFHQQLHPSLSSERLELFESQKTSLWLHGFIERDFSLNDWVDERPLKAAYELLKQQYA